MQVASAISTRWRALRVPVRPATTVPTRYAALVAALAGLAGAAAFPQLGIWPLMIVSVAGLSWAVDGRRARRGAWLGFLYGALFFGPLLHWTGVYVGPAPWLILAAGEAAFMAVLGAVLTLVQRLPGSPAWVGCAWVLEEALRDRMPFGGFPWGRLAFSQSSSPLRWFVELGGAPLLSFVVAVCGGALASVVLHLHLPRPLPLRPIACSVAVLVVLPLGALAWQGLASAPGTGSPLKIAVIQGSVPLNGLEMGDRARQVLDNHVTQTLKLAAEIKAGTTPRPDLVLWPENSSDVDPLQDASAAAEITRAVKAVGAPVLVGAILQAPNNTRKNAGILWSPTTGPGAMYVKRHPVPFAEYIPLRSIAEKVSSAAKLVTQDMVAGTGNGLLKGAAVPLGDVICFEVAYDELVHSSISAGARLLVVQTNNATFGYTSETYQQLAMTKLRAIETGRTTVQVSTTGASAIFTPDGRTVARSGALYTPAILTATVPVETVLTPAVRLGPIPEYTLAALAVLAALASILIKRRPTPVPEADTAGEMVKA